MCTYTLTNHCCVDDQLTLIPPKVSFGDYDLCGANRLDRCSIGVDRIVDRLELCHTYLDYLQGESLEQRSELDRHHLNKYHRIHSDLLMRCQLLKLDVSVRSVVVENNYISIIGSEAACQKISSNR